MWSKPDSVHRLPETSAKIASSVKRLHDDPAWTRFITKNWMACEKRAVSKLELSMKHELLKFGFLHSSDRALKFIGPYIPDYINFIDRVVLEIHGDYWHANPSRYAAGDEVYFDAIVQRKLTAVEVWEKDARRQKFYSEHGWSVCVLWENDIKASCRRST